MCWQFLDWSLVATKKQLRWLIVLQLDVSATMNQDVGSNMIGWRYQLQISQAIFLVSRIFPTRCLSYVGKCQIFLDSLQWCLHSPMARRSKILILASLLEMPGPLVLQATEWISFEDLKRNMCLSFKGYSWWTSSCIHVEVMHIFLSFFHCSQHLFLSDTWFGPVHHQYVCFPIPLLSLTVSQSTQV